MPQTGNAEPFSVSLKLERAHAILRRRNTHFTQSETCAKTHQTMSTTFDETHYLPFQTSSLPLGAWLVIAPHADDETFGMGGAIALSTQSGAQVDVLIMTDGAQGGDTSDIVEQREQEARLAMNALGCRKVHFLRQPDRELKISEAVIAQVVDLMRAEKYSAIFFPSPVEPHPDHRATAQIAWEALRKTQFSALPFSYEISAQGPCNLLVDISSVVAQKIEVMRLYSSQLTQNAYVERILGLNAARTWSLPLDVSHAEGFYRWEASDSPLSAQLWAIQYAQQSAQALPTTEPLVSVIMRTMNRPEMLREAVRSVASQTHSSIELLVVNDGEADFSSLLDEEATGSIRTLRNLKNTGTHGRAQAANLGLQHANGEFIAFLDDDDWLLPEHISRLLVALREAPSAIAAYSGVDMVRFEDGHEIFMHRFNDPFDALRLGYNNFMPIHAVLFRRQAIERGCALDPQLDMFEDWHFWLQLARLGAFVHVDDISAKYRSARGSGIGLPSAEHDVSAAMLRFVEASRDVWSAEQLRHMCMSTILVDDSRRQAQQVQQRFSEASAQLQTTRQHLEQTQTHLANVEADRQRILEGNKLKDATLAAEIEQLRQLIRQQDQQRAAWQARFEEVTGSRSWRLTAPLRLLGRKARRVRELSRNARARAQDVSLRELAHKSLDIWRTEGWRGFLNRLREAQTEAPTAIAQNAIPLLPAVLVRQADGHYTLDRQAKGYQYIPPAPPADMGDWLIALTIPVRFSIVVPVFNTPPGLLGKLMQSVLAQWYPHWELVLVDDASTSPSLAQELGEINDSRVHIVRLEHNQGISEATNAGVAAATGEYIVFADHDDLLTVDALYAMAHSLQNAAADFLYSDEDKLDEQGRFVQPHFKPDWSPDTMMSTMFTGHLSAVRKSLFKRLGGLRSEVNGCQDWDFVLRLAEITDKINHIPKVLYHWRIIPQSIAADIAAKPYVLAASQKVRADALARRALQGTVETVREAAGYFRVNYHPKGEPLVSIIIPTRDNPKVLARCVDSIERRSSYRRYEIIVLDNGSQKPATLELLAGYEAQARARVIRHDQPFNFSELNNLGANAAQGELLLFLNDDTEVISADGLQRMAGFAQLAHVGAVGAKLLYPNGKVQHNGVLNLADGPGHALLNSASESPGYFMRNLLDYNWLAVTGACLMVSAEKFRAVGGFDENFPVGYNDVDLCFRLVDAGLYNVVCSAVQLTHYESQTRGLDHLDAAKRKRLQDELRRLYTKHPRYFQHDPFHNPNLHPNGVHFELLN